MAPGKIATPLSPTPLAASVVPRGKKLARLGLLALGYATLFVVLASGRVPCAFAQTTGHPCPGCGTTRSALALLHGDVLGAFRWNPLGPVVIGAMFVIAADSLRLVARDGDLRGFPDSRASRVALGALVAASLLQIVVWVARFFGYLGGPVPVG